MKTYDVSVPITGYYVVSVDAESEEEAIEKAMALEVRMNGGISSPENETLELVEWSNHEVVTKGNVFYGMLNIAEATEA